MGRELVTISISGEISERVKDLREKRMLSEVCEKAIKEYFDFDCSLDTLKKRKIILENEKESLNIRLNLVNNKIAEIESSQLKNKLQEANTKEEFEKEKDEKLFNMKIERLMDWVFLNNKCNVSQGEIRIIILDFLNNKDIKCKLEPFFADYLKTKGFSIDEDHKIITKNETPKTNTT